MAKAKKEIKPTEDIKPKADVKPPEEAKPTKLAKPKYDPKFYDKDGWPKLPDFLNRKLIKEKNEQLVKKTKKQKGK